MGRGRLLLLLQWLLLRLRLLLRLLLLLVQLLSLRPFLGSLMALLSMWWPSTWGVGAQCCRRRLLDRGRGAALLLLLRQLLRLQLW